MKPSIEERLSLFKDACRRDGLRVTPQRLEIFQALARASDHPSAEQLHQRLQRRMPTLSLDTVYRTLATLVGHGLVCKVETVESQARYEIFEGPHHHVICRKCGEIIDFTWPLVDACDLPENVRDWGDIDRKSVTIYGVCRKCL